ncbi:hypothetical protein CI1B_21680 [Bradyrhizobium ivorense]|jgi:hypothetical protein|uniref:DUF3551 domain-containing protein n=1 Tax=Bradyrhizobium ivorense TaxID=2511166 RepID=A0A508T304_9BRAD|nr:DUF3551 domain-containing protein [Bradyrhizobium ivorense]MCC8941793.1 DUF3551 domain-containing protein [Bradyrhizobium ivorense]VIO67947.1 hypothetical protein CI41S_13220 [Bradyrhizobium ivorense]VIO68546.1 hypothetical protein CI1B_21680 [Bradyrhizobium ivorense]
MKLLGALLLALGVLWMTRPAAAQTYDARYPICMRVYGELIGERMDCLFTSMDQCQGAAAGLPATCLVNPYYAARQPRPRGF